MAFYRNGKFNAKKVKDQGYVFDSLLEHRRFLELQLLIRAGEITGLEVHPSFPIVINDKKVCIVELDFGYKKRPDLNTMYYDDCKGFDTDMSKLKRKLLLACYPGIHLDILRAR